MSDYTILLPKITSVSFAPNPVDINAKTKLTVAVTEETIVLEPEILYSGEIYAGEV